MSDAWQNDADAAANKLSALNVNASEFVPSWLPKDQQNAQNDAGEWLLKSLK